jgi:hypothetical protein
MRTREALAAMVMAGLRGLWHSLGHRLLSTLLVF